MSSKIIDEDGDALDDRLVGDKKADKTALKDIAERVDNIRLVKLPISILELSLIHISEPTRPY